MSGDREWVRLGDDGDDIPWIREFDSGDGVEISRFEDGEVDADLFYEEIDRIPHVAAIIAERDALKEERDALLAVIERIEMTLKSPFMERMKSEHPQ